MNQPLLAEDQVELDRLLEYAVFGFGLPAEAEQHLLAAGLAYQQGEIAERHLWQARVIAPDHAAVLIAFYRFYFYKGRLREAREIACECLLKTACELHLPEDWRQVRQGDAEFSRYEAVLERFYLFTLKGYAYLEMRLGNYGVGREALMKLLELDAGDKFGGRLLLGVLERMGKDDDE